MRTNTASTFTAQTHEGKTVPAVSQMDQLIRTASTCLLFEDTFYESGEDIAKRLHNLVQTVPLYRALELAQTLRHTHGLRHAPLWILNACLSHPQRNEYSKQIAAVIANVAGSRADLPGELLAMYWKGGKRPLAKALRKGLAQALLSLSSHAIQKYAARGPIRLRDVLFLVHAKPRDEVQAAWFKMLADDTLPPADTWEVQLSAGADKRETFQRLMEEEKIGALALLRNLRNAQDSGVPRAIIVESLYKSISSSKFGVLPFQFVAAARMVPDFEPEIEHAMLAGIRKLDEQLGGHTLLMVDRSGSMQDKLSGKSTMLRSDAAAALAILLREKCADVTICDYGTDVCQVPARRGFALRDAIRRPAGGTLTSRCTHAAMQLVQQRLGRPLDRVIVITDEQTSHFDFNLPQLSGGTKGYVMNVAPYQNGIAIGSWVKISGFSEHVVKFIIEHEKQQD